MTEKEKLLESLETMANYKWTCNDHKTCATCVYFYCSCPGLNNSSDMSRQKIPKNEKIFIKHAWKEVKWSAKYYLFWERFRDIGIDFKKLHKVRALTLNQIQN